MYIRGLSQKFVDFIHQNYHFTHNFDFFLSVMVKIQKDAHYNCIFYERFQKGTYCHPAHTVLSDEVKVEVNANHTSPYTTGSAPTWHYFSHKSACRSSLNVLCTVFFNIPSSDDKFRSVSPLSVVNQVFDQIFARMVDLMIDIPQLPSSVKEVLIGIANATFKTLMIVCIFSDRVLKSSYASVYEFYPAKRKTVSLQCISCRRLTSCLISRNSSPLDVFAISPPRKMFQSKH